VRARSLLVITSAPFSRSYKQLSDNRPSEDLFYKNRDVNPWIRYAFTPSKKNILSYQLFDRLTLFMSGVLVARNHLTISPVSCFLVRQPRYQLHLPSGPGQDRRVASPSAISVVFRQFLRRLNWPLSSAAISPSLISGQPWSFLEKLSHDEANPEAKLDIERPAGRRNRPVAVLLFSFRTKAINLDLDLISTT